MEVLSYSITAEEEPQIPNFGGLTLFPSLSGTFENGADFLPHRNAAVSMILAQCKLHVEEWDSAENGHDGVGKEEGAWGR